jgi:hypothetical protein
MRSPLGGLVLMIGGPLLAATIFVAALWSGIISSSGFIIMLAIVMLVAGGMIYQTGASLRTLDGREVMRRDPRPPVLYLRPFSEDKRAIYDGPQGKRVGADLPEPGMRESASPELKISKILEHIGPFVAVGIPGERLAPMGAARIYMSHNTWQGEVAAIVDRAAALVLQPEATPSTYWELEYAMARVDPRRILMIVPDPAVRPLGYRRIRQLTQPVLPHPLPAACPPCDAFMFDAEGRPLPLLIRPNPAGGLAPFVEQVRRLGHPKGAAA